MGLCRRVESYLDKNGALPACSLVNRATSDRDQSRQMWKNTKMIREKLFFLKIIHDSGTPWYSSNHWQDSTHGYDDSSPCGVVLKILEARTDARICMTFAKQVTTFIRPWSGLHQPSRPPHPNSPPFLPCQLDTHHRRTGRLRRFMNWIRRGVVKSMHEGFHLVRETDDGLRL
jgi:hypothetical protein